jgi:hypothetical protein
VPPLAAFIDQHSSPSRTDSPPGKARAVPKESSPPPLTRVRPGRLQPKSPRARPRPRVAKGGSREKVEQPESGGGWDSDNAGQRLGPASPTESRGHGRRRGESLWLRLSHLAGLWLGSPSWGRGRGDAACAMPPPRGPGSTPAERSTPRAQQAAGARDTPARGGRAGLVYFSFPYHGVRSLSS